MKKLVIFIICVIVYNFTIERNYNDAIMAAKNSCGSDSCIEEAMTQYGYSLDVFENPNIIDHIRAFISKQINKD